MSINDKMYQLQQLAALGDIGAQHKLYKLQIGLGIPIIIKFKELFFIVHVSQTDPLLAKFACTDFNSALQELEYVTGKINRAEAYYFWYSVFEREFHDASGRPSASFVTHKNLNPNIKTARIYSTAYGNIYAQGVGSPIEFTFTELLQSAGIDENFRLNPIDDEIYQLEQLAALGDFEAQRKLYEAQIRLGIPIIIKFKDFYFIVDFHHALLYERAYYFLEDAKQWKHDDEWLPLIDPYGDSFSLYPHSNRDKFSSSAAQRQRQPYVRNYYVRIYPWSGGSLVSHITATSLGGVVHFTSTELINSIGLSPKLRRLNPSLSPAEMARQINETIKTMTSYGYRTWVITKKTGCVIQWSNASAKWYAMPLKRLSNRITNSSIRLDANLAYLPFSAKNVTQLIEADVLIPLPLYEGSFEAKVRSGFDPIHGITMTPNIEVQGLLSIDLSQLEALRKIRDSSSKTQFIAYLAANYAEKIDSPVTLTRIMRWAT